MIKGFERFRDAIAALPRKEKYDKPDLLRDRFRLFGDGRVESYYAPFDHLNSAARVVLVGVTPGWSQMERAYRVARQSIEHGLKDAEVLRVVKRTGAFSGAMRNLLVSMLDGVGLHTNLRIASSAELFDTAFDLAHFTSAVSAPTFKDGENYTGRSPALVKHRHLRKYILENLGPELGLMQGALVVPLGAAAETAIPSCPSTTNS